MPLPLYTTPTAPTVTTLGQGLIVDGGILELYERAPDGTMTRLAYVTDLAVGLQQTTSLTDLTRLEFTVPWDRFIASRGDSYENLRTSFANQAANPFEKRQDIDEHTYLFYTNPPDTDNPNGRQYRTRIASLDRDDTRNLRGTALCAAVELSDTLTQYYAGRSQFPGLRATDVARHVLDGDQSVLHTNPKFVRDSPVRLTLASAVPDQSPLQTMARAKDIRAALASPNAGYNAAGRVIKEPTGITIGWPNGSVLAASATVGVTIDAGPDSDVYGATVKVQGITGAPGGATVYLFVRCHDGPDPTFAPVAYSDIVGSGGTVTLATIGTNAQTLGGLSFEPHRYLTVMLFTTGGTLTGDALLKINNVSVFETNPNGQSGPLPFVTHIPATNPTDAALFPGLPRDTMRDSGAPLDVTPNTGAFGYTAFHDPNICGAFETFLNDGDLGKMDGPITWFYTSTPLRDEEPVANVSRAIYGLVLAPATGTYTMQLRYKDLARVFWRGEKVVDDPDFTTGDFNKAATWATTLTQDQWYPFIIHNCNFAATGSFLQLNWTRPDGTYENIPDTQLSPDLYKGLCLVRLTDVNSATRFLLCYKDAEGKGLVIAFPLPNSVFSSQAPDGTTHWPSALPAGAVVEEFVYPIDDSSLAVKDWGSGWTRRAGTRIGLIPPTPAATINGNASGYR